MDLEDVGGYRDVAVRIEPDLKRGDGAILGARRHVRQRSEATRSAVNCGHVARSSVSR
jgi:hypothetical protein